MALRKPRAVIFDMDGLMLDTESIYKLGWQQAALEMGYDMNDTLYANFVGHGFDECKVTLLQMYGDGFPLAEFLKRSLALCRRHVTEYGIPRKAGLMELLDWLDNCGMQKAIATSSGRSNALFCLGDLAPRMEVLVTRDDVAQVKPQPDLYLAAVQRLGLSPAECLALEDSGLGVQAAYAAQVNVIMVPDLLPPSAQSMVQAVCICASLHEVKALLQGLNES